MTKVIDELGLNLFNVKGFIERCGLYAPKPPHDTGRMKHCYYHMMLSELKATCSSPFFLNEDTNLAFPTAAPLVKKINAWVLVLDPSIELIGDPVKHAGELKAALEADVANYKQTCVRKATSLRSDIIASIPISVQFQATQCSDSIMKELMKDLYKEEEILLRRRARLTNTFHNIVTLNGLHDCFNAAVAAQTFYTQTGGPASAAVAKRQKLAAPAPPLP